MQGPLGGTLLPAPATSVSCLRRAQPPNLACPSLLRSPEKEAFKKRAKLQQDNSEETDDNEGEEVRGRPASGPRRLSPTAGWVGSPSLCRGGGLGSASSRS